MEWGLSFRCGQRGAGAAGRFRSIDVRILPRPDQLLLPLCHMACHGRDGKELNSDIGQDQRRPAEEDRGGEVAPGDDLGGAGERSPRTVPRLQGRIARRVPPELRDNEAPGPGMYRYPRRRGARGRGIRGAEGRRGGGRRNSDLGGLPHICAKPYIHDRLGALRFQALPQNG